MAKYDVTFSCGHTETIELLGKEKNRRSKIEFFEEKGLCSECYKKSLYKAPKALIENSSMVIDFVKVDGYGNRKIPVAMKTPEGNRYVNYQIAEANEELKIKIPISEMTGSEKQIIWARNIQENFFRKKLEEYICDPELVTAAKTIDSTINDIQGAVDLILESNHKWMEIAQEESARKMIDMSKRGLLYL